jgi:hypothetical protein
MKRMNSYLGTVAIGADVPFEGVAKILNGCLRGFCLLEEETGRFEEIPAYVDEQSGVEVQLFGIPEGEDDDHYIFKVRCIDDIDPVLLGKKLGDELIVNFTKSNTQEKNGYVNVSQIVLEYFKSHTSLKCWVPQP